jgi:hypothetical protein
MSKFSEKLKGLFIDDLPQAYKKLSIITGAGVLGILELQNYLPELQQYLPESWVKYAIVLIMFARIIKQK